MEEANTFLGEFVGAQFSGSIDDLYSLILILPKKNVESRELSNEREQLSLKLSPKAWASLYFLFINPDGTKKFIAKLIEESDYFKNLK